MKSSNRGSRPVSLIAIHTAEGSRTARDLASFFNQASTQASSHVGIDASGIMSYLGYDRAAWTLRSGNPISDNAELCAFAAFTRAQWLGSETVKGCVNPRKIFDNAVTWAADRCRARGIPARRLTHAQVRAGEKGIIGHVDWTLAMRDGSHTDPGGNFPWDVFISEVQRRLSGGNPPKEDDDMSAEDSANIRRIKEILEVLNTGATNAGKVSLPAWANNINLTKADVERIKLILEVMNSGATADTGVKSNIGDWALKLSRLDAKIDKLAADVAAVNTKLEGI